jgi:hypothetical protein
MNVELNAFTIVGILNGIIGLICLVLSLTSAESIADRCRWLSEQVFRGRLPFVPQAAFYTKRNSKLVLVGVGTWLVVIGLVITFLLPTLFGQA